MLHDWEGKFSDWWLQSYKIQFHTLVQVELTPTQTPHADAASQGYTPVRPDLHRCPPSRFPNPPQLTASRRPPACPVPPRAKEKITMRRSTSPAPPTPPPLSPSGLQPSRGKAGASTHTPPPAPGDSSTGQPLCRYVCGLISSDLCLLRFDPSRFVVFWGYTVSECRFRRIHVWAMCCVCMLLLSCLMLIRCSVGGGTSLQEEGNDLIPHKLTMQVLNSINNLDLQSLKSKCYSAWEIRKPLLEAELQVARYRYHPACIVICSINVLDGVFNVVYPVYIYSILFTTVHHTAGKNAWPRRIASWQQCESTHHGPDELWVLCISITPS
jgi:hypothetical protein